MPTLRDRLQADLAAAIRGRDRTRIAVLRTTVSALSNAESVDTARSRPQVGVYGADVARRQLTEDDVLAVVEAEHDELIAAIADYDAGGRSDAADDLRARAAILAGYLSR